MGIMMMNMNDVKELKDVLSRIEGKLIAASKMYSALNFAMWEGVMVLYYIFLGIYNLAPWETALYWIVAFAVAMYFSGIVWKRLDLLEKSVKKEYKGNHAGVFVGLSWGIGALLGWWIIHMMHLGVNEESSMAIGFLSFIAISVFGMWLTFTLYNLRSFEMLPAFVVPVLGIPFVMNLQNGSMVLGGFFVAFGFTLTIVWYLYNAFRVIEG